MCVVPLTLEELLRSPPLLVLSGGAAETTQSCLKDCGLASSSDSCCIFSMLVHTEMALPNPVIQKPSFCR